MPKPGVYPSTRPSYVTVEGFATLLRRLDNLYTQARARGINANACEHKSQPHTDAMIAVHKSQSDHAGHNDYTFAKAITFCERSVEFFLRYLNNNSDEVVELIYEYEAIHEREESLGKLM